jgi:hypothetical protein
LEFETARQCGIFCWILKLFDNVVFFVGFWNCLTAWNFLLDFETVQQCGIFIQQKIPHCWTVSKSNKKFHTVKQFQNPTKNTTLSNSFKIQQKIPHCWTVCGIFYWILKLFDSMEFFVRFWNCSTMWYFLLDFETVWQCSICFKFQQKIPHCQTVSKSNKKYHIVEQFQNPTKNTTLSNSFKIQQKIPHCWTVSKSLDFETVRQCSIFYWILKLFDNVVFFVGIWNCSTVWYFLLDFETVQQCGIFYWILKLFDNVVFFVGFWNCLQFQNPTKNTTLSNSFKIQQKIPHCRTVSKSNKKYHILFDSVVFFVGFWNCSTMWYFLLDFETVWQCSIFCWNLKLFDRKSNKKYHIVEQFQNPIKNTTLLNSFKI